MINFVVIGAGWRSEFYLRIAKAVPEVFNVRAVCARNEERARELSEKYGVRVVKTVDEVLKEDFDFVVNCINKEDISDFAVSLADLGHYVLCETPIIAEPDGAHAYDKIQVAEQFHLKGTYQAIKKIIDSGIIGGVNHINLSMAHDYHGMSLIRFLLDEYQMPQKVGEHIFESQILKTNGRAGELAEKYLDKSVQKIKVYRFGDKTAVYDFTDDQYFSPIRRDRLLIRGTRGEVDNSRVRYFNESGEFIESEIALQRSGLLDGFYNDRIVFGSKVLFEFPFKEARLSEEETAIAQCLLDMKEYIKTGKTLYSYDKAYEDYSYFEM